MRSIYCKPETPEEHAERKTEKAIIAEENDLVQVLHIDLILAFCIQDKIKVG